MQYQRVSERNKEMTVELHSLRAIAKEKEGNFKEMEELDKFNETLLQEMKQMREEVLSLFCHITYIYIIGS